MRVLRNVWPALFAAVMIVSCAPQAAVTPRAAFEDLRSAYRSSDAAALEKQLSRNSIAKIREIAALFSRMEDRQMEALSGKLGIPADRLRRLSVRDYCAIALAADGEQGVVRTATRQKVVGVDRKGNRAVIRVANGMELSFTREGPYWKFDMSW